ncbi:hypothetical protein Despr_0885 [Candidatus Vecturithrix granuli]|uniref:Uncharacterized protein n=1 Tax=Vecturithrix granuli TaxID=1499967 RepID=A0A081C992_VECG1|nr:hypothetical protein Despr_0885 [Candidatus Vecturithrix granuli]
MAIFRCSKCGHLREVSNELIGTTVRCPQCKQPAPIHNTVAFIEKVLERYMSVYKELHQLQQQLSSPLAPSIKPEASTEERDFDIHNTKAMTYAHQYEPIVRWFQQKQIQLEVDQSAVDTTGFFDEVALSLGDQYDLLKEVSDRIARTQRKGYTSVTLNFSNSNQKEIQALTAFCQELYEYSFVAKYFYQNKEKRAHLTLQTAPAIVKFFNGEWLEWFVFMKLLSVFKEKRVRFSCLRSLDIIFPNEDRHELDVFFLINEKIPLCIECKSGEFRSMIEKYVKLRNRLQIERPFFLLLVLGLSDEQSRGLTSMYEMTFVNEKNFLEHVQSLLL